MRFISKLPVVIVFVFVFISTFLLSFLLLSCYSSANAYSGIYLTSYTFNKDQLSIVSFNDSTTSEEDLSDFGIKVGYLNFCIQFDNQQSCSSFDNVKKLQQYPVISVDAGEDSTSIDLVKLAKQFNDICYSYVLMAVLVLTLLSLLLVFWTMVPLLPLKSWIRKILCVISPASAVLWGLGSMLQHEATKANKSLVPVASMGLVYVKNGTRAAVVTWMAFGFLILISLGNGYLLFAEIKAKKNGAALQEVTYANNNYYKV